VTSSAASPLKADHNVIAVPTRTIPNLVVRLGSPFSPRLRRLRPDIGYRKKTSNEKARRVLGWSPRDAREAIADAVMSMVAKGLVK
jgi:nucleoside-diphosphate-sugar epimerase